LLKDERSRAAVETGERFVDQLASEQDLRQAGETAWEAYNHVVTLNTGYFFEGSSSVDAYAASSARAVVTNPAGVASYACSASGSARTILPRLLRDVVGNPFRLVALNPAWQTADVRALAQAAYDNRAIPGGTLDCACLAVLADALEDVGANPALLDHLRGPGPHVRGCWVLDLCLGRE
jgi:hypothetical protein